MVELAAPVAHLLFQNIAGQVEVEKEDPSPPFFSEDKSDRRDGLKSVLGGKAGDNRRGHIPLRRTVAS